MCQVGRAYDVRHKQLWRAPQNVVMPAAKYRGDCLNAG